MKSKFATVLFIGLLVISCLSLASAAAKVKCPDCKGLGTVDCPKCGGTGIVEGSGTEVSCDQCSGIGTLTPTIQRTATNVEQRDGATYVNGTFRNKETFDVTGTVTASLSGHTNSTEVTFPAGEDTIVPLQLDTLGNYPTMAQTIMNTHMDVTVAEVTCPKCDGTGFISSGTECTKCKGTGTIDCPTCDGTGYVTEAQLAQQSGSIPWATIEVVVAVVAVAGGGLAAFMVLKKRRVNERSLRRLSSREFNDWVLKRLEGRAATSRDTTLGIDGYTRGGQPVLIKQADDVGMLAIDNFAAALSRSKARNGVIVAYSFGSDAVRGKVRAQLNYKLQIEMLTVRELIESKRTL